MTITVCIPIYNCDVRKLVRELESQMVGGKTSIMCIDDGSKEEYRALNIELQNEVKYVELPENVGRARVRNKFLDYVEGGWLLFIDCDAEIDSPTYIKTYLDLVEREHPSIVCGGHKYVGNQDVAHSLRYEYGKRCEEKSAIERMKHPNRSFMPSNLLIKRELFAECPFDESLSKYGHEDTLMGYELSKRGVSVLHIDNNISLREIDSNAVFMEKTDEVLENLAEIAKRTDDKFAQEVKLLCWYKRLKRLGIIAVLRLFINEYKLKERFKLGWCNMFYFKLYKLLVFDNFYTSNPYR